MPISLDESGAAGKGEGGRASTRRSCVCAKQSVDAKNPLNPVAAADSRAVTSFWSARQRVTQNTTAVAEGSHNGSGAAGWKLTVVLAQADSSAPVRRAGVARARHVEMDMQQISVSAGTRGLQALSMLGAASTRPQPG